MTEGKPKEQCWHKEINDEGICKACGTKAAIKLPFTPEEFRKGLHTSEPESVGVLLVQGDTEAADAETTEVIARHEAPAVAPNAELELGTCEYSAIHAETLHHFENETCVNWRSVSGKASPAVNQELKEALRDLMSCAWEKTIGGDMRVCIDSDSYARLRALSEEETKA